MNKILTILLIIIIASCSPKNNNDSQTPKEIIVSGKILNFNPEKRQIRIIANRLGLESERYYTELNDDGVFKVKFKSYLPGDARFTYNKANFLFLAHPGDSIHVQLNDTNQTEILKTIEFSGNNAESNQKVLKFQIATNFNSISYNEKIDNAKKALNSSEFSKFMDSINELQLATYNTFLENEKPDKETQNWALIYSQEPYNYCMTWYPDEHLRSNNLSNWKVPLSYYDYQKKNLPIKNEHLISTYQIKMFANQYLFGYVQNHIYEENKEILNNKPESINQDSLWINGIIKYTQDPLLRQLLLTERISIDLDKKKLSTFENYQKLILANITAPFLLKPLENKFKIVKEQVENPEISSNSILKDMRGTEIETIMDSILKNNKGKLIYIDFWGPWCAPCIKELPYSKKIMDELTNENIAFVYLCIDSDYKRWKAKISELKLEGQHYFFDKKQSIELRRIFKINGVPRYVLLNKEGIIIDQIAKRPSDPKLKDELLKLSQE